MTKLFGGLLGAGALAAVCSIAACTVSTTSDVSGSGSDGGKSDGSSSSDGGASDGATTTDGGGDGGGTCKLKVSVGDTACDNCATTNCCDKVNACADNAECAALDTCLGACLDVDGGNDAGGALGDCQNACYGVHPTGKDPFDAVTSCIQSSCSSTCK